MARIKLGAIITDISGKVGGHSFQSGGNGSILRRKTNPKKATSSNTAAHRNQFYQLSEAFRSLNEQQLKAWFAYANSQSHTNKFGQRYKLTPRQSFFSFNFPRIKAGEPISLLPYQPQEYLLQLVDNAFAGFGLRLLNPNYSSDCITIGRDSDNQELNIGFSGIDINTSDILSFVGSGNGYVKEWFDQSGNGFIVSQLDQARQPLIAESGSIYLENGKPALKFSGSQRFRATNFSLDSSSPLITSSVFKVDSFSSTGYIFSSRKTLDNQNSLAYNPSKTLSYQNRNITLPVVSKTISSNQSIAFTSNIPLSLYVNDVQGLGSIGIYSTGNNNTFTIGSNGPLSGFHKGSIQELVFWQRNVSANRNTITDNQNEYYSAF
jgi:hypothetical protein